MVTRINSVTTIAREVTEDWDPDTSYLEQDGFEDRREAYERRDFYFVGVRAVVDVEMIDTASGYTHRHRLMSPGLWGVESDSDEAYLNEIFRCEQDLLIDDLIAFGCTEAMLAA